MDYPRPSGYVGVGRDGSILRTLDGHLGVNVETDPDLAVNHEWRRNERDCQQSDLGGFYDAEQEAYEDEG